MQGTSRAFQEILRVPHAEVWLVKNKEGSCLAKGNLEVLYNKTLHFFILRIHDFKIALEKYVQVVGTLSEKSKYHSYLFAHPDGFIILKIIDSEPACPGANFETLLRHTSNFVSKSGLEHRLDTFTHGGVLHKAGEALSKATTDNTHPNQRLVRTFDELIDVESTGVPIVDIPSEVVQNMKDETDELVRNHQETEVWKEYTKWGGIEGDTLTVGQALPQDNNSTTELGSKLDGLKIGENKDLKIPEGHVDPALGTHIPAYATVAPTINTTE